MQMGAASSHSAKSQLSFFFGGRHQKRLACYHIAIMPADRGELKFFAARVFIPENLLPLADEVFAFANLHPMTHDRIAILRLSGQEAPIAGRFVEVAGARKDVSGLPQVLTDLGLPPALFAPVAWGVFNTIPWSSDF